jgi:hypothetical protein
MAQRNPEVDHKPGKNDLGSMLKCKEILTQTRFERRIL